MFLRGILQRALRRNSSLRATPSGNWSSCRKGLALLWYLFIINSSTAVWQCCFFWKHAFEIFWNKQLWKYDRYFSLTSAPMVRRFMATISLDRTPIIIPNPLSALSTQIGCRQNGVESGLNMGWFRWSFLGRLERNPRWKLEHPESLAKKKPWTKNLKNEMGFLQRKILIQRVFCRTTNLTKRIRLFDLWVDPSVLQVWG